MATTTDYINQLKTDKTNLVNNLNTKGVSAAQNETFTSLVPKVLDIETGITPTGTINITENGTYDVSDKASANVNVSGEISDYFADNITTPISNILKKVPVFTVTGTSARQLFWQCSKLTTIPQLDTSNVTNISQMFYDCSNLTTIPLLNFSNVKNMYSLWGSWGGQNLTTLGGFQNLGQNYDTNANANYSNYKLDLSNSSKLTHDSLMNVINNLYDIATKGCNTQRLSLTTISISKLSADEIAIATNKGWSVS